MKKITAVSNILVGVFTLYFIYLPITYIHSWISGYPVNTPYSFNLGATVKHESMNLPNFLSSNSPAIWKIAYSLETTLIFALHMLMAAMAVVLFRLFNRNIVFDIRCARLIYNIGIVYFAVQLLHIFSPAINTLLLGGAPITAISALYLDSGVLIASTFALLMIIVSWIMKESEKLHAEQALTI